MNKPKEVEQKFSCARCETTAAGDFSAGNVYCERCGAWICSQSAVTPPKPLESPQEKCFIESAWGCMCRLDAGHKEDHYGMCDYDHHWPAHIDTTCNREQKSRTGFLPVDTSTFHFFSPAHPCSYWSSGAHIVANGVCRCERRFVVHEVTQ